MKRMFLLVAIISMGATATYAEDLWENITKAKAQEYVHAVVQLKLEEINLKAGGAGEKDLKPLRDRQAAINEELMKLALAPLQYGLQKTERELDANKKVMNPGNPAIIQLKKDLDDIKGQIEYTKAMLRGEPAAPEGR